MRGSTGIGIVEGEGIFSLADVGSHIVKQRSGDLIVRGIPVKGSVKGPQCVPCISVSGHARCDAVLIIRLAHKHRLAAARAVSGLCRLNGQRDAGDHFAAQVHAGKAEDTYIIVAGVIELLTGNAILCVGARPCFPGTHGSRIGYCCCHVFSFLTFSRYRSGKGSHCSAVQRQTFR